MLTALLVTQPAPPEIPQSARLVEMVVARVDRTVITLSDLIAATGLHLLRERGPAVAARAHYSSELLHSVLRQLVHRELLLLEVRRLQLRPVPDAQVSAAYRQLRKGFIHPDRFVDFLVGFGFMEERLPAPPLSPPENLAAVLRADLQAQRFLELRIERGLKIDDKELLGCAKNLGGAQDLVRLRQKMRNYQGLVKLLALLKRLADRSQLGFGPSFEIDLFEQIGPQPCPPI